MKKTLKKFLKNFRFFQPMTQSPMSVHKQIQPNRSSRLAGYTQHIYIRMSCFSTGCPNKHGNSVTNSISSFQIMFFGTPCIQIGKILKCFSVIIVDMFVQGSILFSLFLHLTFAQFNYKNFLSIFFSANKLLFFLCIKKYR